MIGGKSLCGADIFECQRGIIGDNVVWSFTCRKATQNVLNSDPCANDNRFAEHELGIRRDARSGHGRSVAYPKRVCTRRDRGVWAAPRTHLAHLSRTGMTSTTVAFGRTTDIKPPALTTPPPPHPRQPRPPALSPRFPSQGRPFAGCMSVSASASQTMEARRPLLCQNMMSNQGTNNHEHHSTARARADGCRAGQA